MIFEKGYGHPFNIEDEEIAEQTGGIASRHEILADIGAVIIAKPILSDLEELKVGGILWGYPHCVQQAQITQTAIDKKQTLIHLLKISKLLQIAQHQPKVKRGVRQHSIQVILLLFVVSRSR